MRKIKNLWTGFRQLMGAPKTSFVERGTNKVEQAAAPVRQDEYEDFFRYTSGRWLYNEPVQLAKRYIRFDVLALQQIASQTSGSRCVEVKKLPEGLYNKVLSLRMENGKEILARIPNPNAGHPYCVVASEVATLDYLRNVLHVPVPRVIQWSSRHPTSPQNLVNAEYMLVERVPGRQLCEVWPTMSEAERFGLVKSLVQVENRLTSAVISSYGSLYYRHDQSNGLELTDSTLAADTTRFVVGPVTEPTFWAGEKGELDIDRGPWNTAEEYFAAVARCEIAWMQEMGTHPCRSAPALPEMKCTSPAIHVRLLKQYLRVLPHILPPGKEITRPVLWHHDLHLDNIFVDETDPTQISGIIDWQGVWAAPLFVQARFPSLVNCPGPYTWGAVEPQLPADFDSLSPIVQEAAADRLVEERQKKFYEMASRKFNPLVVQAMDTMRNEDNPATFLFHLIGRTGPDGPIPLQELLMQVYEKWDWIVKSKGLDAPCPISFTHEEMHAAREHADVWAAAVTELEGLRLQIVGQEGWVSHGEYDEAMTQLRAHQKNLEELRERVDWLSARP